MTATNTTRSWTGRYWLNLILAEYEGRKDVQVALWNDRIQKYPEVARRILEPIATQFPDRNLDLDDSYVPSVVSMTFDAQEVEDITWFFALLDDPNISLEVRVAETPHMIYIGAANRQCGPRGTWFSFYKYPQWPDGVKVWLRGVCDPDDFPPVERPKCCGIIRDHDPLPTEPLAAAMEQ